MYPHSMLVNTLPTEKKGFYAPLAEIVPLLGRSTASNRFGAVHRSLEVQKSGSIEHGRAL